MHRRKSGAMRLSDWVDREVKIACCAYSSDRTVTLEKIKLQAHGIDERFTTRYEHDTYGKEYVRFIFSDHSTVAFEE